MSDEVARTELLEILDNLLELINVVRAKHGSNDFFNSVEENAESMKARITAGGAATDRSRQAAENWTRGISAWLHYDDEKPEAGG